ncbi:hypothetical protein IQ247_17225 [Plectonema cf. radiosum LEGE 06105]|uniref:Uncharacterized protein n=1 Tax=Plectonema cf. radiosum LEGE 06105 TaxID=945769 RepID=A0A8J7FDJ0_9CYAN|nr:hypothetical protein [Plectonema radiosum]MBE9214388.1 hypothetical protein [Plectonema cf. radiosum LEGE 06105]
MSRSLRNKLCSLCGKSSFILYRVKYYENGDWVFVCPQCWEKVSQNNPFYVYGGTWKAKKK